jgi:hypothetical protein
MRVAGVMPESWHNIHIKGFKKFYSSKPKTIIKPTKGALTMDLIDFYKWIALDR